MSNGIKNVMMTTSVKIDSDIVGLLRAYKIVSGVGIQHFIEEAIKSKIRRIPKKKIQEIVSRPELSDVIREWLKYPNEL